MFKQFDRDYFSRSITTLGEQIGPLTNILSSLSSARGLNSSHEFTDYQMSTLYGNLYDCFYQRKNNIINFQIALGKRETVLYELDKAKGYTVAGVLDAFESLKADIHTLAEETSSSAFAVNNNSELDSLISKEDMMLSFYMQLQLQAMNFDYDKFNNMSQVEKLVYMNKLANMSRDYMREHDIDIEIGAKKYIYLGSGFSIYFATTPGLNYEINDYVNVDLEAEIQNNFAILTDDKNDPYFEVSLSDIIAGRYTKPIIDGISLYIEGSIDPMGGYIYIENGVSEDIPIGNSDLTIPFDVCCGVEIYNDKIDPFHPDLEVDVLELNKEKHTVWDYAEDLVMVPVILLELAVVF